jgi:uncharacterized protein YpuA (DUF1002 family)
MPNTLPNHSDKGDYNETHTKIHRYRGIRNLNVRHDFTRQLDRDLDYSRVNGSRREDQINQLANRFRDAVNNIDNNVSYGRRDNDVDRALQYGSNLERGIRAARISSQSMALWQSIRSDLQMLGNGYFQNDDRYNRNRNGGYNTRTRTNLPTWWPF